MIIVARDLLDFTEVCEQVGINPKMVTFVSRSAEIAAFPTGSSVYVTDKAHERDNYPDIIKAMKMYAMRPMAARMNPTAKALHVEVKQRLADVQMDVIYKVLENPSEGKLSSLFMEEATYLNDEGGIDVKCRALMIPDSTDKESSIILN